MRARVVALSCGVLALVACGAQDSQVRGKDSLAQSAGRLSGPATLQFDSNWTNRAYGTITPGGTVNLIYAFDRLSSCGGQLPNGQPGWTVTAFYQVDGGPVGSTNIGGYSPDGQQHPSFQVPAGGADLAVWFQITNVWGCSAYDSNFGANYHFAIRDYPIIHFAADWTMSIEGTLPGSTGALVDYDLSRLPSCRQDYNGSPTWDVLVWYRWDGGAVSSTPVTVVNGMTRVAAAPLLVVPQGGTTLEMWFENSDRAGCVDWDSAYGSNYRFGFN